MVSPAPQRYVVRKPSGDPDAARALASAYGDLALALHDEVRHVVAVLAALDAQWRGAGAHGSEDAERALTRDAARVSGALERAAGDLRHYAHRLAKAHEHHGWSVGKLVALGAMVTVGAAAVVVTVGAAAPAEAAAAAAAVEGAEAAAASAGAASVGIAGGLDALQALFATVRPLSPFVLPHLVSAGSSLSLDAATELVTRHRLDAHSLEVSAAVGFAGSAIGGTVEAQLAARASAVRRLAEAGTWAAVGSDAAYADTGRVDPLDSLSLGLGGLVARDVRYGVEQTRLMWKLRVPQLPLGLATNREWRDLVTRMYTAVDRAGFPRATLVWRGSSITGFNYKHGHPFDSLYRSDWDLALVDERAYRGAKLLRIRGPLDEDRTFKLEKPSELRKVGLLDVTRQLSAATGRRLTWMVYKDMAAVAIRPGNYLIVPRP